MQTLPCGFNLVRLPFNDEVSLSDPISEPPSVPAQADQGQGIGEAPALMAAKAVVKQLHIETVTALTLITLRHALSPFTFILVHIYIPFFMTPLPPLILFYTPPCPTRYHLKSPRHRPISPPIVIFTTLHCNAFTVCYRPLL